MKTQIILASASPRRRMLMEEAGIVCETVSSDVDESLPEGTPPRTACMYNALRKAQDIAAFHSDCIVIGADTIVWDGRILGKPADPEDSFRTLSDLRNRAHRVLTGVCIIYADKGITRLFCEETEVVFGDYSDQEIRDYIQTGEPADKAGSYAVQGGWSVHVERISGDYNNVVGLPVERLKEELSKLGTD